MISPADFPSKSKFRRTFKNSVFKWICAVSALVSVAVLGVLLVTIGLKGFEHFDWSFLTSPPSRKAEKTGMGPAIWGSISICAVCALTALPLGVGTAIFLEEYKPKNRFVVKLHAFLQLNIANLAGVPSIVYGIIGLTAFVQVFGVFGNLNSPHFTIGATVYDQFVDESGQYLHTSTLETDAPPTELEQGMTLYNDGDEPVTISLVDRATWDFPENPEPGILLSGNLPNRVEEQSWYYLQLPFGRGVLAGGLTLMLVILPIVIISSQEAIRAVPNSLREGALAAGSTRWQMIWRMTLPASIPGIMTGSILAMSRAIGEAAPILVIAGIVYIRFLPRHLMDEFTAMPLQIYDWAGRPQEDFRAVAATGIIVLLVILLVFNATAVFIRQKFQKQLQ